MKISILILYVLAFLFNLTFAQEITQEERQVIIANLDSSAFHLRYQSIKSILEYQIHEAVNKVEEKFWDQESELCIYFLRALKKYNSPLFINFAHALIDSIDFIQAKYPPSDPLKIKVEITELLFGENDYSTTQYIFQLIERDKPKVNFESLYLLDKVIENVPEYETLAKDELIRASKQYDDKGNSSFAVAKLVQLFGQESLQDFVDIFINHSDSAIRRYVLKYLQEYQYQDLNNLLKSRFVSDEKLTSDISYYLLKYFGQPSDVKFILDNLQFISDSLTYSSIKAYYDSYEPVPQQNYSTLLEYLDYSNSLCDTLINYSWLGDISFSNELKNILTKAKSNLQNGDSLACRVQVKAFQDLVDNVYKDSLNTDLRFVTIESWKFLYWNAQYILDRLPEPPANPNLLVNLKNSLGNQIPASNVKYYEGSWKDAVNNGDGTFTVITTRANVSIRVFYEYASQQVDNVPAQNNTYTFTTVNAAVQLKNSSGNPIDQGTVQYYAGAWRTFGATSNGVAYKELLPINYSFRMTYEFGSIDKQQNLSVDPTVVFQTVNAAVQLKNSLGNLIDAGTVQYYAGAWRSFGTTSNGVANKELLPTNYSFRMTYEFVSNDKQQNLSTNPVVDFSTVLCSVKVSKTSNNEPINNAAVKYYSSAWRNLGTTNIDGITTKELLPANLSFRATSGSVSLDKQQDISVNSLVEILLNVP